MTPIFDEIRAKDLTEWADRAESERLMPSLMQQLIFASGADIRSCRDALSCAIARPDDIRFTTAQNALGKNHAPPAQGAADSRRQICAGGEVKGDTTTLEDFSVVASLAAKTGKDED